MESSGDDPGDSNQVRICGYCCNVRPRQTVSLQFYPVDERQWLLGTSYNTGIECLQFVKLSYSILSFVKLI